MPASLGQRALVVTYARWIVRLGMTK